MERNRIGELIGSIANDRLEARQQRGVKVAGYGCLLTPIELIDAAGLYPYRIRALAQPRTDLADARLSRFNCGYCRACLQLALEGEYDFLDLLVESNGCDQLRGMFENWQYARPAPAFHYLKVPHLTSVDALGYFEGELRSLAAALAEVSGVAVTDERLWAAIERQERVRGKLLKLYELREATRPRVLGSEVLEVMIALGTLCPEDFEGLLDEVLAEAARRRPLSRPAGHRLLLGGAATDEVGLLRDIESLGGQVVADTLCFGARAVRPLLAERPGDDPWSTLVDRYLTRSMCPRMYEEFPARLEFLLEAARRAEVAGVILVHNKFCDVHGIDNALLRLRLEERGLPVLTLEKEYGAAADRGRITTRVQAFMERIGGRER